MRHFAFEVSVSDCQATTARRIARHDQVRRRCWPRNARLAVRAECAGDALPARDFDDRCAPLRRQPVRTRSAASMVDKLVGCARSFPTRWSRSGCACVMARVFFLSGQAKIEGPGVPIQWTAGGLDFSVTLPAADQGDDLPAVRDAICRSADSAGDCRLSLQPMPSSSCRSACVLGFATRFAAAGAAGHDGADCGLRRARDVVADARLLGRRSCWCCCRSGPGAISIDALIRSIYQRDRRLPRLNAFAELPTHDRRAVTISRRTS